MADQLLALRNEYDASKRQWIADLRALAEEKRSWESERSRLLQRDAESAQSTAGQNNDGEEAGPATADSEPKHEINGRAESHNTDVALLREKLRQKNEEKAALMASLDKQEERHQREIEAFRADHEVLSEKVLLF